MADNKPTYHPTYVEHRETWKRALDVYEGTGGFMDPDRPYLVPHPREWLDHSIPEKDDAGNVVRWVPNPSPSRPSRKLMMRRKLARYENIAEAIVGSVFGALFRSAPARQFETPTKDKNAPLRPIQQWLKNVDGKNTSLDQCISDEWVGAATFGHLISLVDPPAGPKALADGSIPVVTEADRGLPRLRAYTPLDMIDWLTDEDGKVTKVKLQENEPRAESSKRSSRGFRIRVVDEVGWELFDSKGARLDGAEHKMGRLPIAFLYGRRRPLTQLIGKSIMGDPNLYIDIYNLHSEERELLRGQTFGILNVPIGADGDVEKEKARLGSQVGTDNVMFSSQPADFISPDSANVKAYHDTIDRVVRSVYRLAKAAWEGDSRVPESADSRRIKRDDQHQTLAQYANECQRTDDEVVELAYRAFYGADRWEAEKVKDGLTTRYPEEFTPSDIDEVVSRVLESMGLDLGPTATKLQKKAIARQLLPGVSEKEFEVIDGEIDAQKIQTAEEKQAALLKATAAKFGKSPGDEDDPDDEDPDAEDEDDKEKKGKAE